MYIGNACFDFQGKTVFQKPLFCVYSFIPLYFYINIKQM